MRITWVTRSFLDYRIPVFRELNELANHNFKLIYSADFIPERVHRKICEAIGENAWGMRGESFIGDAEANAMANHGGTIPWQPGLQRKIKESKPDVLVCDGFFQWTFGALWYHFWHGTPIVMLYERTKHTERNCPWYRRWYRKTVMGSLSRIVCNGSLSKEYVQDNLGYPEIRLSCGQMAADVVTLGSLAKSIGVQDCLSLRERFQINGLMLLSVGRMIPLKGFDYLIDTFQEAQGSFSQPMTLVLVGDGPELEKYKKKSVSNVIFTGGKSYDEMALFYRTADAFIIATLEDNWSLVVPEAMSCGLPIASSIYNGCWPELVTHENGWTFDPLDSASLRQTLESISSKTAAELRAMGQKSQEIVMAGHTPAHAAKSIFHACMEAVNSHKVK